MRTSRSLVFGRRDSKSEMSRIADARAIAPSPKLSDFNVCSTRPMVGETSGECQVPQTAAAVEMAMPGSAQRTA